MALYLGKNKIASNGVDMEVLATKEYVDEQLGDINAILATLTTVPVEDEVI